MRSTTTLFMEIKDRWANSARLLIPLIEFLETQDEREPEDEARLVLLRSAPDDIDMLLRSLDSTTAKVPESA